MSSSIILLPPSLLLLLFTIYFPVPLEAVKCFDCTGADCLGDTCEGDYCVLAHYAPTWGVVQWGQSRIVKGCMSGKMLKKDVQSHCKTIDSNGEKEKKSTCFCNDKDYCNGMIASKKLETQNIPLVTCVCEGSHCDSPTCTGEFCTFVINHKEKNKIEKGCINATVPLMERRFVGACMIPPATGAMHHTVVKSVEDLLLTESCICAKDYCNTEKLEPTEEENQRCEANVQAEIFGVQMFSRNVTCTGEYCFKTKITSESGHLTSYATMGCVSYIKHEEFAEELHRDGCAKFENKELQVEACLKMGYIKGDEVQNDEAAANTTPLYILPTLSDEEATTATPFYTTTSTAAPEEKEKDSSTFLNVFVFLIVVVGILFIAFAYKHFVVRGNMLF